MSIEDEDEQGTSREGAESDEEDESTEESSEESSEDGGGNDANPQHGQTVANVAGGVKGGLTALGTEIAQLADDEENPEDQTGEDIQRGFGAAASAVGVVEQGARAWNQVEQGARADEDSARVSAGIDAVGSTGNLTAAGLDAIGQATNDQGFRDAAAAVRGAAPIVTAAAHQAAALFQQGDDDSDDAEDAADGASEEASDGAESASESASEAVSDAGAGGGEASMRAEDIEAMEAAASGASRHVRYELHLPDSEVEWTVRGLEMTESLNETFELSLNVTADDRDADSRELLGANVELLMDRAEAHHRRVTGVVRRVVESSNRGHHISAQLFVVPALWALGQGRDSRIFQDMTAKAILEEVLTNRLGAYSREVDVSGLEVDFPVREFCVQYRESDLDFCHRLMEEEGIGYYLDADGEGWEKVVLFDHNRQLPEASLLGSGPVRYAEHAEVVAGAEPITRLDPSSTLTPTSQVVRDYDWTQGATTIEATQEEEDARGRVREVYDHGLGRGATRHDYGDNDRYGGSDIDRQAEIRRELHRRDGSHFTGVSCVVGFGVGRTFEVSGHPTPGVDGRYLLTAVTHHSEPAPGSRGDGERYHNRFECIPLEVVWRPERRTPKPAIFGTQTAVVTGDADGDINTDYYGRVRVLFHWDRYGGAVSSCWIRVAQTWGGYDGMGYPGFVFIPRVGMEVVVTFVDGDPDRPLVTGCVYNANHPPPETLPAEASRSMIRTRSLGGSGYNELSFEDAEGGEEVHLRAERNLRELVRHDHMTRVGHDQTLQVDNEQHITVDKNQTVHIKGDLRDVHVDHEEHYSVDENRQLTVGGTHEVTVHGFQMVEVDQNEEYTIHGTQNVTVERGVYETITRGHHRTVRGGQRHVIHGSHSTRVHGDQGIITDDFRSVRVTGEHSLTSTGATTVQAQEINLTSQSAINVTAPQGIVNLTPAAEEHWVVQQHQMVQQAVENISGKMGSYSMAIGNYGLKMDTSGMKIDTVGVKIASTGLEVGSKVFELKVLKTIQLTKSPLLIIG